MPALSQLPDDLPQNFSVAQARALGVVPGRLCLRSLERPFHGVRARLPPDHGSLESMCRALAPRLSADQFFSHETAFALLGGPMPEWPYVPGIHVSTHRPAREPRTRGVIGHRLQRREPACVTARGLRIEHPVRAWRQIGTLWAADDIVAATDFLLFSADPLGTAAALRHEASVMGDLRGGWAVSSFVDGLFGDQAAIAV